MLLKVQKSSIRDIGCGCRPSIIKHVIHKVVEGDLDMNARRKKWFPILAASLLLAGSLAGCSGSEPKPEAAQQPAESKTENVYKDKYDPEVTITTVWGVDPTLQFKNGETIENNVATKWAKEKFGINIKSLWSITDTNGAFATKLRLAMSSGQEMRISSRSVPKISSWPRI